MTKIFEVMSWNNLTFLSSIWIKTEINVRDESLWTKPLRVPYKN